MALIDGTGTRYDFIGLREDLSDIIYDISPQTTPFLSSIGKGKANQTLVEWQTDSLASAAANAQLEGDAAAYTTPAATVRVGNYCQISRKTASVSRTMEAVDKAGRKSEMAYQLAKRSAELKRDMEYTFLAAQAGNAGGVGTARTLAGLNAWIKTNDDIGTSGGSPTYSSGVPSAVRTDGTLRAFTETILKNVQQLCWTSGGEPKLLMVGPVNKAKVSAFAGIATKTYPHTAEEPTSIIGAADVYVGDFGVLRVVANRFQREADGWLLDPDLLEVDYLRPFQTLDIAPTGDSIQKMLVVEYTLKVKQEAGLGLAADLTTT